MRSTVKRKPTDRMLWARRIEYVHETLGHHLTIFSERVSQAVPIYFLKLRPGPEQLFAPQDVVDLLALVGPGLHLPPLRLSSVEVTDDFAVSVQTFERLKSWLWGPRIRRVRPVGEENQTLYLGSPKSGKQVKVYWKQEAGMECARLEYTFRRKVLRRLGITRPADLLGVEWGRLAKQCGRFVELDTARTRREAFIALCLRHLLLHMGVRAGLRGMRARDRRWAQELLVHSRCRRTWRRR